MPDDESVVGTSFDSFTEAAKAAFDQIPGDPDREGAAAAEVRRLWLTKGGIVGRVQYHAELAQLGDR
jgi:hypothetical protein